METAIVAKIENMCRACMGLGNVDDSTLTLQSLYDCINLSQNQKTYIFELMQSTIQQLPRIEKTDALPKAICGNCLLKLSAFHDFQQCCVNSDIHLRSLIAASSVDLFTTSTAESLDPLQYDKGGSFNDIQVDEFIKQESLDNDLQTLSETINDGTNTSIDKTSDMQSRDVVLSEKLNEHHCLTVKSEHSSEPTKQDQLLVCQENRCGKKFSSIKYLKRHIKRMHCSKLSEIQCNTEEQVDFKNEHRYKCDDCESTFEKKSYLRKHMYRHKRPGGLKNIKKCGLCEMVFHTAQTLKSHYLSVHQSKSSSSNIPDLTKPYICEYCNKGFQQSCTLKDHKRIHTNETPFLCSHCGKSFKSNSNLQQHALRHTGERRYECPDCPKKFPCISDLLSHKQVHKKLRPHVCDICGAAFGRPSQLKKHKMYHSGEKPFQCEYCEMRFVCADHMRRHTRTHTGEKPYKCKYCTRSFTQSNDMIKHLRLHLGVNVYQCELCPSAFRLAAELRDHFALHKNDDEETRIKNKRALSEAQEKLRRKLQLDCTINIDEKNQ